MCYGAVLPELWRPQGGGREPHFILSLPEHVKWHLVLTLPLGDHGKDYEGLDDGR